LNDASRARWSPALEIAGLATPQVDHSDDLDVLLDELFAFADELEGLTAHGDG
jgi:hypothetical protein